MTAPAAHALVRVVVLNHDGGDHVLSCLDHLSALEWPDDRLEVVVVDNASSDGSPAAIRDRFPAVRLIAAGGNLGFAGGNNLALRDLAGVDYVALLNNDAFVEPAFLGPLVAALEADAGLGAACPKILFAPRFRELALETEAFAPGRGDPRRLGVRVSGVRVDGLDRTADAQFAEGFYGEEEGTGAEERFRWSGPAAVLRLPSGGRASIRVAGERAKPLGVRSGPTSVAVEAGPTPAWVEVPLDGRELDVVQNAGSVLVDGGYAADRGFLEVDRGQYDAPADVFAWCGCAVLLRPRYLEDAGLLDDRFFLYYEDTDLSWRGRLRGWRYGYVPGSVVRHVHAGTSVEGSPLFQYYVERNRLLVHLKNAPAGYAARALGEWALPTARFAVRDVVHPLLRGERPRPALVRRRLASFGGFLRLAPAALAERRRVRGGRTVGDDAVMAWVEPRRS